jgi:hypothetical protein
MGSVINHMKYGIDLYEMVFPKYAKLQFKINRAGNLTVVASPSLTPGVLPEGVKGGQVPKGTRVFDYDQQIVVSLIFADCLKLISFAKSKSVTDTVEIFRNSAQYNKRVNVVWNPQDNEPLKAKFASLYFQSTDATGKEIKFKLPLSIASVEELAEVVQSYVTSFSMVKLFCQSSLQDEDSESKGEAPDA